MAPSQSIFLQVAEAPRTLLHIWWTEGKSPQKITSAHPPLVYATLMKRPGPRLKKCARPNAPTAAAAVAAAKPKEPPPNVHTPAARQVAALAAEAAAKRMQERMAASAAAAVAAAQKKNKDPDVQELEVAEAAAKRMQERMAAAAAAAQKKNKDPDVQELEVALEAVDDEDAERQKKKAEDREERERRHAARMQRAGAFCRNGSLFCLKRNEKASLYVWTGLCIAACVHIKSKDRFLCMLSRFWLPGPKKVSGYMGRPRLFFDLFLVYIISN